jgi:serine/threonine-protein kinase
VSRSPDRIGEVIADRYELLDVVGRGGQGLVYKAFDRWMGKSVAIKVLGSKAAKEPQMAQRMVREQQALAALKGTSAVELLDVCRGNDGELCLVMELLAGVDLDEFLYTTEERGERVGLFRVAEIFDPIVETLAVAHEAGILHRDLKPANVFLLEAGGVRLLDFGLARVKSAQPLTAAGTVMGSPSFMAPEAWKGQSELVDHRADVYSLGVILFRVLAGELPFSGESLHEKFLGSTKAARPSLLAHRKDLPRDADDWVAEALAIDREERFQNVRAMWNAFLSTFDVQPPKRGKQASIWDTAKRTVQKLASAAPRLRGDSDRPREPSYDREALAKSMLPEPAPDVTPDFISSPANAPARPKPSAPPRPRPAAVETTVEITDADFSEPPPPPPRPPPPRARAVEQTLELSDGELSFGEDTIPEAQRPEPSAETPPTESDRKKARNKRRRERKKRRKKKR